MKKIYFFKNLLSVIVVLLAFAFTANAQSKKISMQGFLKDANGKAVTDGNKVLTFKIYDAISGGTALWTKVFSTVPVQGGVYAVQLGLGKNPADIDTEISALLWDVPYYVGITVESETELTPRTEFTYAPYTFAVNKASLADVATRALTADAVGGGVDLAINNSDANIRIIKNSTSPIDKNIYIGNGSGAISKLYLYSNNEVTMSVENKNVGIGLSGAPSSTLDVARGTAAGGTATFQGTEHAAHFNFGSAEHTYIRAGRTGAGVFVNDSHSGNVLLAGGGGNVLLAGGGGRVGIGSGGPPQSTLVVRRGNAPEGSAFLAGTQYGSYFAYGDAEYTIINGGKVGATVAINSAAGTGNVLIAGGGGRVGIGSIAAANPQALLHIGGTGSVSGPAYYTNAYFASTSTTLEELTSEYGFPNIVVRADGSIWCNNGAFTATSDKRIKNIIGLTSTGSDLAVLSKIEITDYKYKDEVANGKGLQKKVIAQQLQEVYPIAVTSQTGIVPNVFAAAEKSTVHEGATIITTASPHDFATGDLVKLIIENTSEKQLIVNVIDAKTFSVEEAINEKVFVYGKSVNDLLTVDYDAVAMLNVSATQELAKQIEQLKAENIKLKTENKSYENRLGKIEAMLQLGVSIPTGK
jgi:hypothetical protein